MGRCKYCGKEIDDKHLFCNRSCAAKFNGKNRVRKPWTEKQRQEFSDRQCKRNGHLPFRERTRTCECCGQEFHAVGRRSFCPKCLQKYPGLWGKIKTLKAIGVWEQSRSLEDSELEAKKILSRLYFEEKESLLSLSKRFGICKDTVKYYVGEKLRNSGEATKLAFETGRKNLTDSDTPNYCFKQGTHTSWEGHKFHFRSSWEEQYMQELDKKKVPYLYEAFRIRYFDTQKSEERVAVPDFFLPDTNTIVELKSSYTYDEQNMKDRFKAYQERGYKTILLLDWQEQSLQ